MRCRVCGTELLPGKAFCHVCGARVVPTCANCGAELPPGARFCPDCGQPVPVNGTAAAGQGNGDAPSGTPGAPAPANGDANGSAALGTAPASAATPGGGRVPEALAEKIRLAHSAAGERKQVTVLFCDLAGSTAIAGGLDPEVYRELLEQYIALAMHEVYRLEGIVNQLAGDGFMALFGAPLAHEDAPARAVHAALAIRDALAHFNAQLERERGVSLPARLGLNTGPVVVGTVGNDLKMDYTAIGDTTNLAARLEQLAAPGTVLISESTARLVRGLFRLRPVGPLTVKGKPEPVPAYEVLEAREQASPMEIAAARGLTPFVGRDEELAHVQACFARISGGYTQAVAVIGDAGSGKSRLIYEFRQRLADHGTPLRLFEGRCSALNQAVPLAPFVSMLRQYFGLSATDDEAAACAKVEERLDTELEEIESAYPLLCRVLSVPAALPPDLPLESLKQETFQAVARLVMAESRRAPVLLVIEDLHWIDEPSRELLEMALARLTRARVMVLVSHRPEFRPSWRTGAAVTHLHLRPLLDDDVIRIARALAGGPLPDVLEGRILAKAEGSPFFAEEITRSLAEEGFLTRADDGVELTRPVSDILIPGSVREVLAARLDRLPPSAKRVAQLAAVLGRQFRRSDLVRLLDDGAIDVAAALEELCRRGVIHRKSLFDDDEYRFGESLTQEVAYDSLLHRQRRELHGRVAALLEAGSADTSLARPALIAHHYALSADRAKAVATLLHAAVEAEQLPSYRTALDLCRQAWEIGEAALREGNTDPRFPSWVMDATLGYVRITVLYGSSSDPEAERAAERCDALARTLGRHEVSSLVRTLHGMLLTADPARFAEGLALTERAVAEARASEEPQRALAASRAVAWHYLIDGRFAEARATIEEVLRGIVEHGAADTLSELYLGTRWMREGILQAADEFDLAQQSAAETYGLAQDAGNRTVQSGAAAVLAHVHWMRARPGDARVWAERSLETAEQIGSAAGIQRGQALVLAARVLAGESVSLGGIAEALEEGVAKGGNMILSVPAVVDAYIGLGEVRRAERVARLALERAAGRYRETLAFGALGEALVRLGPASWAEAERCVDRALALAETIGSRTVQTQMLIARARLALEHDDSRKARHALEQARQRAQEVGLARYTRLIAMLVRQTESGLAAVS